MDRHGEGHVPGAGALSRVARHAELDVRIRALFTMARQHYESPRVHGDLREAGLPPVSRKRVARLMRQARLRGRYRKRNRSRTNERA